MMFEKGIFTMSEEVFSELCDDMIGLCTACGEEYDGSLEPDAHNVECSSCGEEKTCGVEELMLMGRIELQDDEFEE